MLTEYEAQQLAREAIRRFAKEHRHDRPFSDGRMLKWAVCLLLLASLALLLAFPSE